MPPTHGDKLAASAFALGLSFGCVRREGVVQWADRRIVEMDSPPDWLIDLSLSQDRHLLDLISELKKVAEGVDPVATCQAAFALLPEAGECSFDQAEALVKRLYKIAYRCLNGDWRSG